jgi:hypothetical protein
VLTSRQRAGAIDSFRIYQGGTMQDPASELRRILIPRTPVYRASPEMRQAS